ncbi:MAG: prepilin-type N-terminal cleavage/methylation domain-containing protein [Fimbriimonas sp.]|nr:prepilin-type N-terminal cleavage/methylation domain-containing protein [Fimbriimonas sp.]
MRQTSLRNRQNAFTLVELLIVIIIIAVLAAIAIPKFSNSTTRSKESALRSNLKLVRNAVDLFRADTGLFPKDLASLSATAAPAQGYDSTPTLVNITASDWRGPYLQAVPKDFDGSSELTYTTTLSGLGTVKSSISAYSSW